MLRPGSVLTVERGPTPSPAFDCLMTQHGPEGGESSRHLKLRALFLCHAGDSMWLSSAVHPTKEQACQMQDSRHRPSCSEVLRLTELQLHTELSRLRAGNGGAATAASKNRS